MKQLAKAMGDLVDERKRQHDKWGEQNHDPEVWQTILSEEVGELAECILHWRFGGSKGSKELMRKEAIQVAAVALSFAEFLDRAELKPAQAFDPKYHQEKHEAANT